MLSLMGIAHLDLSIGTLEASQAMPTLQANGTYVSVRWAKQSVLITESLMGTGIALCPSY